MHSQLCSWENLCCQLESFFFFFFPPLKLCKSPVNLEEFFGNKNSLHWTTPRVETWR